eukprot:719506-Prymnesium_polylepis.1
MRGAGGWSPRRGRPRGSSGRGLGKMCSLWHNTSAVSHEAMTYGELRGVRTQAAAALAASRAVGVHRTEWSGLQPISQHRDIRRGALDAAHAVVRDKAGVRGDELGDGDGTVRGQHGSELLRQSHARYRSAPTLGAGGKAWTPVSRKSAIVMLSYR